MPARPSIRVGIDVGGTFTDLLATADGALLHALKVSTTPLAPQEGVLEALRSLLKVVTPEQIVFLAHSTTIATNALLGQMHLELPRVALITTAGFRDVIEIGRQNRSEVYNLFVQRPRPLVRREDRLTVRERVDWQGNVLEPLDRASLEAAIEHIERHAIPSVAIGFLHSYVNGAHERFAAGVIAEALPHVSITLSSQIDPEYREYERFSTAVVNAALLPIVGAYLQELLAGIAALGISAPLYVMQSNGGMTRAERIAAQPATMIESGPASGVIAAAATGARRKQPHILSFDMGGTTAKAGTIIDGRPQIAGEFEAAGRTHSGRAVKGSGYPVRFPFVDLAEVSAGGGTIAWLDEAGALRAGPLSAGADPGPAAYGKSDLCTVTDANVVLGRLNQTALLGGTFPIDAARSHAAVAALAVPLGMTVHETAAGIVRLVDNEMAKVLRIVTVERGYDPRDFTLVAFGGNGALHACSLADELGIRTIVIPPRSGLFSAYGLLVAPLQATALRPLMTTAHAFGDTGLHELFAQLESDTADALVQQGAARAQIVTQREFDMRYAGQSFELAISAAATVAQSVAAFHRRHRETYGYDVPEEAVEFVNARVTAHVPVAPDAAVVPRQKALEKPARRNVWAGNALTPMDVWQRDSIPERVAGPAIVEQYDACTYVAPGWSARANDGDLVLEAQP